MIDRTEHVEGVMYADDIPEGTDYLPGTTDPIPDDYERHFCQEDGEDWPCRTHTALQILRDYLGMASGGSSTDADLWEFAEEALSDIDALNPGSTDLDGRIAAARELRDLGRELEEPTVSEEGHG